MLLKREHLDRTVRVGREMVEQTHRALVNLLQKCKKVFAFGPTEKPSIEPSIMNHHLNIDLAC